eukprot:maker-scaffold157_size297442-snap-gene-1.23 protein:Tk02801 transcript:maker-scaffold157_size297442-snap-gene-1.23-mRNA-1 annotation:"limbic system-associated membrane"
MWLTSLVSLLLLQLCQGLPQHFIEYSEPTSSRGAMSSSVAVEPRITSEGQVFRVQLGETLLLPCQVQDLGPMILLWKKGSRVLTAGSIQVRRDDRFDLQSTDLQIKSIEREDSGDYICELETDEDQPTAITHSVEILVPPTITTEPSNGQIVVKKGTTVSLSCEARGNPQPQLSWSKSHDQMPKSDISSSGSTLILADVTRHHAGVYKCHASNRVGQDATEEIHLQVLYEPEVKAERPVVHGGVGYQVELVCLVYSEPAADVLWYKDTMLLDSNGKRYMQQKGNRFTMLIRSLDLEDFGNYSCSASNMLGKSKAYVRVQGNPNTPIFNSRVDSKSPTNYKLSWITESYAMIEEYRLLYRKLPDDPSKDIFYAYNNIIINGVGTQGFEHHQSYILENLIPNSMYEAQIQAKNKFGWSAVSDKFQFFTRGYDAAPIESSVKNPASAPFGINSAERLVSQFMRYLYLFLALFLVLVSYVTEQSTAILPPRGGTKPGSHHGLRKAKVGSWKNVAYSSKAVIFSPIILLKKIGGLSICSPSESIAK